MSRLPTFLATAALLLVGLAAPVPAQAADPIPTATALTIADEAAEDDVVWDPEPTVARIGPGLKLTLTMATYLHDQNGLPMAGAKVEFTLLSKAIGLYETPRRYLNVCTAVADANGFATCKGKGFLGSVLSLLVGGAYATLLVGGIFPSEDQFTKLPVIRNG